MEMMKSARPITSRPLTSSYRSSVSTSTGLTAPKSSRGKTALRRQVQDKSYFIGLLRMRINELNNENNQLLRECEIMTKEEQRINVYRQKAETFARELNELTIELMTYNEFVDRMRIDDELSSIKDDINEINHENQALTANIENDYQKLHDIENLIKQNDEKMNEIQKLINIVKSKFSAAQLNEFDLMQQMNNELTKECHLIEQEINMWRTKKNEIEEKIVNDNNLITMELIKAMEKKKNLEKQKSNLLNSKSGRNKNENDLAYDENAEENERKNLLAQVKRDNNYINTLQNKIEQLLQMENQINNEIEFYNSINNDPDKLAKFSDLKQQDKIFNDFVIDYNNRKKLAIEQLESINNEINDLTNKLSRLFKYLNEIKRITNDFDMNENQALNETIIQKRKLELEIHKNKQNKDKYEQEKETLTTRIDKLKDGIKLYSNINDLKEKIQKNVETIQNESKKLTLTIEELKIDNEKLISKIKEIELKFDKNESYQQLLKLEKELSEILRINNQLKSNDNNQMIDEMKSMIMDTVKKYNQSLIGF